MNSHIFLDLVDAKAEEEATYKQQEEEDNPYQYERYE